MSESTTFKLFEADTISEKIERKVYAVATSLLKATELVEKNLPSNYIFIAIRTLETSHVLVPKERSETYKLFEAEIKGEYAGHKAVIVAETASIAIALLEEWAGQGYTISKFRDIGAWEVYVTE